MQQQKVLTADHYLIKLQAQENNNAIRKEWKPRYTRIKREKKSKLWKIWYKLVDWLK